MTTLPDLETAELQTAADIGDQTAKLGHLLAVPAITVEAKAKRSWSIKMARRELARLERVLHDVRVEREALEAKEARV